MALIWMVAAIVSTGGLLFGIDIASTAIILPALTSELDLTPAQQNLLVTLLPVSAFLSSLMISPFLRPFGRVPVLLCSGVAFLAATFLLVIPSSITPIMLSRVVLGGAVGVSSLVDPLYLAEVSPAGTRGRIVSAHEMAIVVGIMAAYLIGFVVKDGPGWRMGLGLVQGLCACVFTSGMAWVPRSPRWLVSVGKVEAARNALVALRGAGEDVSLELAAIQEAVELERTAESLWATSRPSLVLGLGYVVFTQLTGHANVIYFAPEIIEKAGLGVSSSLLATLGLGVVKVLVTMAAIAKVDHLGRRKLSLIGSATSAVSLAFLGASFLFPGRIAGPVALLSLLTLVAAYALSYGPIMWLLCSELYPQRIRGQAIGLTTSLNWGLTVLVSATFLPVSSAVGPAGLFFGYSLITGLGFVFFWFFLIETNGKSLEEIAEAFSAHAVYRRLL